MHERGIVHVVYLCQLALT